MEIVDGETRRWAVCLYRDSEEEGQVLTAVVIGLPGVASEGNSREEAIRNVKEALNLRFEGEDDKEVMKDLRQDYVIPSGGEIVYVERSLSTEATNGQEG